MLIDVSFTHMLRNSLTGILLQIVEDIVDSGVTMSQLLKTLEKMGVKQKWTAILLSKRCGRKFEVSYFVLCCTKVIVFGYKKIK